jgi:TonB family protein
MRTIGFLGVLLIATGVGLRAQDLLSSARDLYASAAYEEALSTLNRVDGETAPEIARQVDEYRAFCLYALGRTREAEAVAESIIRKDPLSRLNAIDASPRLESMFTDVRKRLLSSLIRDRFRAARDAFDQQRFRDAETQLVETRLLVDEASAAGVTDAALGDLSVLVDGFLQLTRSTSDRRPPSPPTTAPTAETTAETTAVATVPVPLPSPAVPAATSGPRVYSIKDPDVVPPVALEQRLPGLSADLKRITKAFNISGVLSVVIDESGRVVDATIDQAMNPGLDTLVLDAARQWKYLPARKDGVPVSYLKTLVLRP